jgi:hypothetical protein
MTKVLKISIKIIAVCAIFGAIFLYNLWSETNKIENAKNIKTTLDPANLELCEKQSNQYSMYLGCINEEYGVYTWSIYVTSFWFVFFSLLLFKPNKLYLLLTPLFTIAWIILTEFVVKYFNIPVIHSVPMEGDIRILDGLYFQFYSGNGLTIIFIFFVCSIAGAVAYGAGLLIKKFLLHHTTANYPV